jgi:hypothetical protein
MTQEGNNKGVGVDLRVYMQCTRSSGRDCTRIRAWAGGLCGRQSYRLLANEGTASIHGGEVSLGRVRTAVWHVYVIEMNVQHNTETRQQRSACMPLLWCR